MNLSVRKLALLLGPAAALLLAACGPSPRSRASATLDDVESYINVRPDSALAVLQAVDSTALTTRALQARYSLLHTMALDKCYEDITTPGLLDPAVVWYERHGSVDEKMKTLYYQGRMAQVHGNQQEAAVFFKRAEYYRERAKDSHAVGLLYEAMSCVYNTVYNTDKEQEYIEKALAVYKQADDQIYGSALGNLALVYHTRKEWAKADSLYREAIAQSEGYPHSLMIFLSNYARMKVLQPDKDPAGALALLNRKQRLSKGLTPAEAATYAYALLLSGEKQKAEEIFSQLGESDVKFSPEIDVWFCRAALLSKDYKQAYELLSRDRQWEEAEIRNILSESVSNALSAYQETVSKQQRMNYRINIGALIIILLLLSLALSLTLLRKNKLDADRARILEVCSMLEREAKEQESHTADLQDQLNRFRDIARRERVLRFRQAGRLRSSIWRLDHLGLPGWFGKDESISAIKEELSYIYDIEGSGEKLIRRLDSELDGTLTLLIEELDIQERPQEKLFLCCCLLDLPSDIVGARFKWTPNNVRVKKHRLKEQIAKLNNKDYDALFDIRKQDKSLHNG